MILKKPIGGFYELELPKKNKSYHSHALWLTNGRACLSLILDMELPSQVYVPFYTCYALYEPLLKKNISIKSYAINESLEPIKLPKLQKNELFIYINYFGIKNDYCNKIINTYGDQVIIDNTHSFFQKGYKGIYSFTSARKYFGVPDGAYVYLKNKKQKFNFKRNIHVDINHNIQRLEEDYENAYENYLISEKNFTCDILNMSKLSEKILQTIDYEFVGRARVNNFNYIHQSFSKLNKLKISATLNNVPFCYPLLLEQKIDKKLFHNKKLFIPTLWPDILTRKDGKIFTFEKEFVDRLIPIPIDHRYTKSDMKKIIKIIKGLVNE